MEQRLSQAVAERLLGRQAAPLFENAQTVPRPLVRVHVQLQGDRLPELDLAELGPVAPGGPVGQLDAEARRYEVRNLGCHLRSAGFPW